MRNKVDSIIAKVTGELMTSKKPRSLELPDYSITYTPDVYVQHQQHLANHRGAFVEAGMHTFEQAAAATTEHLRNHLNLYNNNLTAMGQQLVQLNPNSTNSINVVTASQDEYNRLAAINTQRINGEE